MGSSTWTSTSAAVRSSGFSAAPVPGKTTTIRLLLGLIRASAGTARVLDATPGRTRPSSTDRWRISGAIRATFRSSPLANNSINLARLRGLSPRARRVLAERLEVVQPPRSRKLSRGNRQKIGVVAVFMGAEPLLVLTSPPAGSTLD